jgi:7-cyano-7-deazaguanine reductase
LPIPPTIPWTWKRSRTLSSAGATTYDIEFTCPEWTALCPRSGFPDFGTIQIKYQPRESIVELKSLKLYINSYRVRHIFHEGAVNQILTDLVRAVDPWRMEVIGDFNVRGNIKTIIRAVHERNG